MEIIFIIIGYSICMAFICDLQKQLNAIQKKLRDFINNTNDEIFELTTKQSSKCNNEPPYTTKDDI